MSVETLPQIIVATVAREGGKTVLRMDSEDRTTASFELSDLALAMLGLTVRPALLAARDELERENPDLLRDPGKAPDSPEGL